MLVAPKTERQRSTFVQIARIENALKRSRATIHPSLPPARPVLFRAFRSKPPSLRSLSRPKSDERRARAHSPPKLSLHIAVVFRAHFPKRNLKKKTREISPPTRRRDLRFHSRTTAFRRAHKSKNETTMNREKKGARVKAYHGDKKSSSRCNKE